MICLTFDTDYMTDAGMTEFLRRYPLPGRGTFFLWRPHPGVDFGRHEIEPHPDLQDAADWQRTLDVHVTELQITPRGVRTHSCVYSHRLGSWLHERGYRYTTCTSPLFQNNLVPYRQPWGLWELPVYYMDSMDFTMTRNWPGLTHRPFNAALISEAISGDALYVFDFHPLHVAMNTSCYEDYQEVRPDIVAGRRSPFDVDFPGEGTRTFYLDLCEAMTRNDVESISCLELVEALERLALDDWPTQQVSSCAAL